MAEQMQTSLIQKINSLCDTYNLHISNLDPDNMNKLIHQVKQTKYKIKPH